MGDEENNRNALAWLKSWDPICFPERANIKKKIQMPSVLLTASNDHLNAFSGFKNPKSEHKKYFFGGEGKGAGSKGIPGVGDM